MLRLHPSTLVAAVLFVALAAAVAGVHGGEMPGYDWIKMSIMSGMWGMDPEDDQYPQRVSPPAPPVPAYMGSLDYGGQPPSYKLSALKQASSWPVDRSEGAPAPLRLQRPSPTPASESSSASAASAQRKEEQASSPPSSGGSGFFRNLLNWGGRAVKAVGTAVSQGVRGLPLFGR